MYIDEKQTTVGHTGSHARGEQVRPLAAGSTNRESPAFKHGGVSIRALEVLAREITERGNDMEVRSSKDGLKVYEVSKRLVGVLAEEGGQNS